MSEQETKLTEAGMVQIPIEWYIPDDIKRRYASNIVVQHDKHEFIIMFFDVQKPILLGPQEDVRSQLARMESIRAECVARIIVAPERMPSFIKALQDNFDRYQATKEG